MAPQKEARMRAKEPTYLYSKCFFVIGALHGRSYFSVEHIGKSGKKKADNAPKRISGSGKENSANSRSRAQIGEYYGVVVKTDKIHKKSSPHM